MKVWMAVLVAATSLLSAAALAQEQNRTYVEARGNVVPVPLPPGGPAPRMADGHVDLSGVWFSGPTGKANAWSVVPDQERPTQSLPASQPISVGFSVCPPTVLRYHATPTSAASAGIHGTSRLLASGALGRVRTEDWCDG